jgi:hypothetical protein
LCLTTSDTVATDPDYTGLPFPWIKDALRESPARIKIVILDCCYAGQAIESLASDDIADLVYVNGAYTLSATTRNQTATSTTDLVPALHRSRLAALVIRYRCSGWLGVFCAASS